LAELVALLWRGWLACLKFYELGTDAACCRCTRYCMMTPEEERLLKIRDEIVAAAKSPWSSRQEFGRYERFERANERTMRVVPKISRVQLGETIDLSTRPPHRVTPVSKVMATHVDSFPLARPTERLQELVEWGENTDEFYYHLRLGVMSLQARRSGDKNGAHALDLITGVARKPPRARPNKAVRMAALVASSPDATRLPARLYQRDAQRRARLDPNTVEAFDALAAGVMQLKAERAEVERHRRQIGVSLKMKH